MSTSEMFKEFLNNLRVDNAEKIGLRYGEITASLNKKFRDTESKTANSLQVGSYGRWTAIKGVSDLDMLYIMPKSKWETYKDGKQSQLLRDTKDAIKTRYPYTNVRVDRLVVTVTYTDFHVEVQPVFEALNEVGENCFIYPDTYNGGSWKTTKPRQEIAAMKEFVDQKNKNLRLLCKMARAWKNKHGIAMGGLLIDTLAYNFLKSTADYDDKWLTYYGWMSRDFFKYLMGQPDQSHYKALGSGQNVKVKKKFQKEAKSAYELSLKAIDAGDSNSAYAKWKNVYGRPFPSSSQHVGESTSDSNRSWDNTEQFIEDLHPIDIRYHLAIDCDVSQNGFLTHTLRNMITRAIPLLAQKKLLFRIMENEVPEPYSVKWKVLNRGPIAQKKNMVRGQIVAGGKQIEERTSFRGDHLVECYLLKNGVVVAKSSIDVPIAAGE